MTTNRLEGFSDGVIAIIITIMVLELEVQDGDGFEDLKPLIPTFMSYLLSFIYIGIYWNNHHHIWQIVNRVNGKILWANLHLLFWLSLFPFTTAWMGANNFSSIPVAVYGFILLMASVAWGVLIRFVIHAEGPESKIAHAYKKEFKIKTTIIIYVVAIAISFFLPIVSCFCYILAAMIWFIPDKRVEKEHEKY